MADERIIKLAQKLKNAPYGDGLGGHVLDDQAATSEVNVADKTGPGPTTIGAVLRVLAGNNKLGPIRQAAKKADKETASGPELEVGGLAESILALTRQPFQDEVDLTKPPIQALFDEAKTAGLVDDQDMTDLTTQTQLTNVSDAVLCGYVIIGVGTVRNARALIDEGLV